MSSSSGSSKGNKKLSRECFIGKKNIVTAELYDDLQDKIDQVKKVVRNRSKIDIALVLRSCEQADNVVDTAIAKLIGPDGGKECLREWAVQSKKNKLKYKEDSKAPKADVLAISKHSVGNRQNNKQQKQIDDSEIKREKTTITTDQTEEKKKKDDTSEAATNAEATEEESNGGDTEERKSRSKERRSRRFKKKPRPPKRIRDKLKQLVPPEKQQESLFEDNSEDSALPEGQSNTDQLIEETVMIPKSIRPEHIDSASTSGIESCTSSISGNGATSPSDNSPVQSTTTDVFSPIIANTPVLMEQLPIPFNIPTMIPTNPSLHESEPSLKKLLKDLHRCDVSLSRYQSSLNEQCDIAIKNLRKVFTIIRIGLSTREEDIFNDLQTIRQTAHQILQRRKATCASLRRLSEFSNHLDENQVQELKQQLKQFITERRVDEDLGLERRFTADPDDLLPSIMKFGKTVGAKICYNSWNEFPGEAIGRSTTSSRGLLMTPPRMPLLIKNTPPIFFPRSQPSAMPFIPGINIPYPIPPHAILNTQSVFSNIPILPTLPLPRPQSLLPQKPLSPLQLTPSPQLLPKLTPPPPPIEEPIVEGTNDELQQYSPTQLIEMQERVKQSLQGQGVCLYNPITGKAMKSELPADKIVKKTPTQQRRERKRRQKERERKQREEQDKIAHKQRENQQESNKETKTNVNDKVGRPATVSTIRGDTPWWSRRYHGQHYRTKPFSSQYRQTINVSTTHGTTAQEERRKEDTTNSKQSQ